jgi:hypothetical protein
MKSRYIPRYNNVDNDVDPETPDDIFTEDPIIKRIKNGTYDDTDLFGYNLGRTYTDKERFMELSKYFKKPNSEENESRRVEHFENVNEHKKQMDLYK